MRAYALIRPVRDELEMLKARLARERQRRACNVLAVPKNFLDGAKQ